MAGAKNVTIHCPKCQAMGTFEVWTLIDVTQHPELRQKVLDGSLFHFHCEHCNGDFIIPNPTLYHDKNHNFMLWLNNGKDGQIPEFSMTGNPAFDNYRCRTVETLDEMNEKIFIFEAGLNDVVVEIIKHELRSGSFDNPEQGLILSNGEYYFHEQTNNGLTFEKIENGTATQNYVVPTNLYNAFVRTVKAQNTLDLPLKFYHIDNNWIKQHFK
ncbi:MAG: CpXC domain-containing protein [Bacteroidales bacterium]|nr:CpXC domain-containing protein [Bacteroidales bacterium]